MEAFSINGVVQATYRYDAMGQQVVHRQAGVCYRPGRPQGLGGELPALRRGACLDRSHQPEVPGAMVPVRIRPPSELDARLRPDDGEALGLVAGTSLYGYAFQSPLRYIDPTGEIPAIIVPMLAGAAVGMVAGYLQTGCVEGAAWGAAIGAGFGYAGAAIRAGAIASTYLGMANSAVSQIAAFEFVTGCECDNQTFNREVFLSTVLFAGLGNAAGARLAGGMGNRLAPAPGGDVLKGLVDGGLGALIGELLGARGPVVVRRVVQR